MSEQKVNKQLRLFFLYDILFHETDENHSLTRKELEDKLQEKGIGVDRKTLYGDLKLLTEYGLDIKTENVGKNVLYHIVNRDFELPELKLLVDAVQASKFITQKNSENLIKKLEGLTSIYEAGELQRQVFVKGRIKTENENAYYAVDCIHDGINKNKSIEFKYYEWSLGAEKVFKHEGRVYKVSPWALLWDNQNYYLVGFDERENEIRHYRVDKIYKAELSDRDRVGFSQFKEHDVASYAEKTFGMYGGTEYEVTIGFDRSKIGIFYDRFGRDIEITENDDKTLSTRVSVIVSDHFISWILAIGNDVRITGPEEVVEMTRKLLKERSELYGEK